MIKKYFFLFLGVIISFFIFTSQQVNAQMGVACYSGSWVQPTCNPNTSDPNNCNILPPLFSGAACDQHTGYLRIQDELSPASQGSWTQLFPGKILLGQVGGGFDPINGSIEVSGSIIAGEFSASTPPTYRGAGDIAALSDIYARNRLQIDGVTTLYGNLNVNNIATFNTNLATGNNFLITNGVAGNATTFRIRQTTGDTGRIMDLIPGENSPEVNNIYFDHLGFLNATKDFQIRIDANDNGNNEFRINNGNSPNGVPVFIVEESGDTTISGTLSVSGNAGIDRALSADSFVANSGQGTIRGKFVQSSNGNICADNQLLVYRISAGVGDWFCTASNSVGTTTVGNLLQVLQAGADASAYSGIVTIGSSQLIYNPPAGSQGIFNIRSDDPRTAINTSMGSIMMGDSQAVGPQAGMGAFRDAVSEGSSDLPTRLAFYTTPDGSTVLTERMRIDNVGNVGVGTNVPAEKLEVNDTGIGTARIRITDTAQNAELQLKYGSVDGQHWAIYTANTADDSFQIWGGGNDRLTILQNGNVGIGTTTPNVALSVQGRINADAQGVYSVRDASRLIRFNTNGTFNDLLSAGAKLVINYNGFYNQQAQDVTFFEGADNNATVSIYGNASGVRRWGRMNVNSLGDFVLHAENKLQLVASGGVVGKFADGDGNLCANNQILVYNSGTSKWVCSTSIPGGSQNLLQVLTSGSNAAAFHGDTVISDRFGVGNSFNIQFNNLWRTLHVESSTAGGNIEARFANESTNLNSYTGIDIVQSAANTSVAMLRFHAKTGGTNTYWSIGADGINNGNFAISEANGPNLTTGQRFTIERTTGYVGIGTTNPSVALEVNGPIGSINANPLWFLGPSNGTANSTNYHTLGYAGGANYHVTGSIVGDLTVGARANSNIVIGTNTAGTPTARLTILNSGNVGIGITNPTAKLAVTAPTAVEGLRIISSNYSPLIIRNTANTADIFRIRENGVVEGNPLNLKSSGYINFMVDNSSIIKASLSTVGLDAVFNVADKIKTNYIETEAIQHTETVLTTTQRTILFKSNCVGCGSGGIEARNIDSGLLERLAKYANYIFAIPSASALPVCYSSCSPTSAALCSTLGTGWEEVPGSQVIFTYTNNFLGCSSTPPDYCQLNTQSWPNLVKSRTCQRVIEGEDLYTKIEFAGSPAGGLPGVTKVKDNLVVEQNRWGDGVTSGCVWVDGGTNPKYCPNGKYVAGFDTVGSKIYCCDL